MLGILVVALGGGAYYFTEHRATPEPQPSEPSSGPLQNPGGTTPPEPVSETPKEETSPPPASTGSTALPASETPRETTRDTTPPPRPDTSSRRRAQDFVDRRTPVETRKVEPAPTLPPAKPAVDTAKVKSALTLGEFYFNRGLYDKAIEAYQEGLSYDPTNAELRTRVARARRAKQAEALLNQ